MIHAFQRIRWAFGQWPDPEAWGFAGMVFISFAVLAGVIGFATGLFQWGWCGLPPAKLLRLVLITLVAPSLVEELLFRVVLIPHSSESVSMEHRIVWALAAWVLFVAAHPLNAWLFRPTARPIFYSPSFLTLAGLLGLACTLVYWRSGSIWPGVLMHWMAVLTWKIFLGGPSSVFG